MAERVNYDLCYGLDATARLLKLTGRRVLQLVERDVLPRPKERNQYPMVATVHAYLDYIKGRRTPTELKEDGDDQAPEADSYGTHRARLTAAKADMAELERDTLAGRLVPREDMEMTWGSVATTVRTLFLGIPSKLAPMTIGLSVPEVEAIIRREVVSILNEFATTPHVVVRSVSHGEDTAVSDDVSEVDDASAGSDGEPMGGQLPPPQPGGQRRSRAVENKPS